MLADAGVASCGKETASWCCEIPKFSVPCLSAGFTRYAAAQLPFCRSNELGAICMDPKKWFLLVRDTIIAKTFHREAK